MDEIILDDLEVVEETIQVDGIDLPMLRGLSAYQVAVKNGYIGTEEQWLASLKGEKGDKGESYDDTEIREIIADKVDKETGKGLSTEDYTTIEKTKLAGLSNYDDTQIRSDITSLQTNKAEKSEIPDVSKFITNTVNDLVYYYKKTETYTQLEVNALINAITTMNILVVQTLPTEDISLTTIYLLPKTTSSQDDVYDEYIYVSNNWEHVGSTEVDLTGYATETWVNTQIANFLTQSQIQTLINTAIASKQDTLVSGTNIKTINNNSILGSGDISIEGNEVFIGDEQDIPNSAKLWIDTDELLPESSEVVNSLDGNETTKAPSVNVVKNRFKYSTDEIVIGEWLGKPLYRKVINIPISTFGEGTATTGQKFYYRHDIQNIDMITDQKVIWKRAGEQFRQFPSIYYANTNWNGQVWVHQDRNIAFELGSSVINGFREANYIYLILEYTKTTD